MMHNVYSIEINRPVEDVFSFVNNNDNLTSWVPMLVESKIISETKDVVGTTYHSVYDENGRLMEMDGEVTVFEPNKRIAIRESGKAFDLVVEHVFEETDKGTKLTQISEVFATGLTGIMIRLISPLTKNKNKKILEESFGKLKSLVESGE